MVSVPSLLTTVPLAMPADETARSALKTTAQNTLPTVPMLVDRSPATSSRSASALNLIGGTWVEGHGNTSRDIYNPADTAEMLAPDPSARSPFANPIPLVPGQPRRPAGPTARRRARGRNG